MSGTSEQFQGETGEAFGSFREISCRDTTSLEESAAAALFMRQGDSGSSHQQPPDRPESAADRCAEYQFALEVGDDGNAQIELSFISFGLPFSFSDCSLLSDEPLSQTPVALHRPKVGSYRDMGLWMETERMRRLMMGEDS